MDIDNEDGNQLQSSSTTISINGTNRHQFSINELLSMIDMIKKCELIWNKNHPEYSHGLSRAVAFEQIAQQLSIPVEDIRWKWQILRKEYFKKISQSHKVTISGQKPRPWKWAAQLSFLNTVIAQNNQLQYNRLNHQQQQQLSLISKQQQPHHHMTRLNQFKSNANHNGNGSMSLLASTPKSITNGKFNYRQQNQPSKSNNNNNQINQPILNSEEDSSNEQTDNSIELQLNTNQFDNCIAIELEDDDQNQLPDNDNDDDDDNDDDEENECEINGNNDAVDDEDLPKFFCETIYSPEHDENENESNDEELESKFSLVTTNQQPTSTIKSNIKSQIIYVNNNDKNNKPPSSSSITIDNRKRNRSAVNDTDNENSAKIPKFNGDQLISNERIDLSSIISLLKTQNEILIIRNRREETLWRQLSDKDNQLNNLNRQRQNEQQKQQDDTFRTYLLAKLSLLQDIPRTSSKWTKEFQTIMDQAFDNVYKKFQSQQHYNEQKSKL
ncbi:uncharacterized protein LOC113798648 [Dermatophagoides pteronyssinus]|uniref:uncharacterized protein LOC113798648 n=1 Tax=Dermatophagoides pteronyssinus TaxID=6956 RepID=UPI003F662EF0